MAISTIILHTPIMNDLQDQVLRMWALHHLIKDKTAKIPMTALFCHYADYVMELHNIFPFKPKTFAKEFKIYLKENQESMPIMFRYENGSFVYGVNLPDDRYANWLRGLSPKELKEHARLKQPITHSVQK